MSMYKQEYINCDFEVYHHNNDNDNDNDNDNEI